MIFNSFSIVIPVYNCSCSIRNSIKSIAEQEYSNVEVIIVDDGSTDDSYEVCQSIALEYDWVKIYHKKNEGQLSARTYGISCATKEWVLFLDADDEFKQGSLKTLNETINTHIDLDCIIFGLERFDGKKIIYTWTASENLKFDASSKEDFYKYVLYDNTYNSMCRKCVRRNVIPKEDLTKFFFIRMGEDLIQSIGIYKNVNSLIIIPNVLYRYYVNPLSVTSNNIRLGYQKSHTPFSSFEFLVDFIKNETHPTSDDCEKLQILGQYYLSDEIYKISISQLCMSKKVELLDEVFDLEICQKFIMVNSFISGWRRLIYILFKKKNYLTVVYFSKIIYTLKRIRKKKASCWLKCR